MPRRAGAQALTLRGRGDRATLTIAAAPPRPRRRMKNTSIFWLLLCPIAIGCGHVGIDDLNHEQLDGPGQNGPDDGGKTGDGDGGEGDMSFGGAMTGMGGIDPGAGGPPPATGGSDSGSGGSDSSTGGSQLGTGGIWEADTETWTDPDRTGCWPFCEVANPSFSTHYLFEQPVVPAPGVESNGELSASTRYAHWGLRSLAVHVEPSPAHAYIPSSVLTDRDKMIYVRAWLYVPHDVVTGDVGLLEFLSGDIPAARVTTHPDARLSVEAPLAQARAMSETGTYPFDEWFCLRAAVHTDDRKGSVTVEASDVIVAEVVDADTRGLTDVNAVNFGITRTGPHQGAADIYWDSLVIDQEPVACDDMSIPL